MVLSDMNVKFFFNVLPKQVEGSKNIRLNKS